VCNTEYWLQTHSTQTGRHAHRLHPDLRGSFIACFCSNFSCAAPAGDNPGSSCRIDLCGCARVREGVTKDGHIRWQHQQNPGGVGLLQPFVLGLLL